MTRRCALLALLSLSACRGEPSTSPPFRLIQNMHVQPKVLPEAESQFFADGMGMRPLSHGVVASESPDPDAPWDSGKAQGRYLDRIPAPVDDKLLARGQERFDVYCSPCHDKAGSGHGIVPQRGFYTPVDLASDHTRSLPDGEIFGIIGAGVRNMPSYRHQVPVADRWAIVAWVRVLQRSQHATVADVGPDMLPKIELEGAKP